MRRRKPSRSSQCTARWSIPPSVRPSARSSSPGVTAAHVGRTVISYREWHRLLSNIISRINIKGYLLGTGELLIEPPPSSSPVCTEQSRGSNERQPGSMDGSDRIGQTTMHCETSPFVEISITWLSSSSCRLQRYPSTKVRAPQH